MKTRVYPFIAAIATGLSLIFCSCGSGSKNQDVSSEELEPVEKRWSPPISHPSEDLSYYWNEWEEYGTYFPSFLGEEIILPQNLKGFGVENEDCGLDADTFLDYSEGDGEQKVTLDYLKGSPGPKTILDTTYFDGNIIVMEKVVAYDMQFFQFWCRYPKSKHESYGNLFRQCKEKFPEFTKRD